MFALALLIRLSLNVCVAAECPKPLFNVPQPCNYRLVILSYETQAAIYSEECMTLMGVRAIAIHLCFYHQVMVDACEGAARVHRIIVRIETLGGPRISCGL